MELFVIKRQQPFITINSFIFYILKHVRNIHAFTHLLKLSFISNN